ncbi:MULTISPECIES: glycosyltransferase family 2 protein [unclassified Streptomyces]|uniref:glycosyltransferase family 2 protein n=1 Tax=unclassified Streptomyces TaxID=2593676 RepID=UPI002E2B5738|nr:glycosyltransferase family 2 protein [Streptomyces sp. NBC_00223]
MTNPVTFSVICPTYNRSVRILPTLRSVLAQTVGDWELLVLSDGSDDDTVEVVSALAQTDDRIRVFELERSGHPSGPRQEGLRRARGSHIAYLDHDDVWRPDHLAWLRTLFADEADGADWAATGYRAVDDSGAVVRSSAWWDMCWHPELQILDPLFEPSRVAHRRGLPESVGGWVVTSGLEDWDLWFRLTQAGHRVRTTTARTVSVFEGAGTRRYGVGPRHLANLLVTPDARVAKRIRDALSDPEVGRALKEASREDSRRRMARLGASPLYVAPLASAEVPEPDPDPVIADGYRGPQPVIVPHRGQFALAVPVYCSTAAHAERLGELLRSHATAQVQVLRGLEQRFSPAAL